MTDELPKRHPHIERIGLSIAAASGLVMAACISALPAATCAAIAETYGRAISYFGGAAVFAMMAVVAVWTERTAPANPSVVVWGYFIAQRRFTSVVFLLGVMMFAGAIGSSILNLRKATKFCLMGPQAASHAHTRIPLHNPINFWASFWEPTDNWE